MRTVNPKAVAAGLALGAAGVVLHLVQVTRIELGWAQPHALGSLSFPQTAALIIAVTAIGGFVVGTGSTVLWSRSAAWPAKRRFSVMALFVLLVVAGGGAWGLFLRPVDVQVTHAMPNVAVDVFGLGTVEARITSKVGFKVAGMLADIRVDVGEHVAKGATLARLDDREQTARVARMKATKQQAEANLERAKASLARAEANYVNAKNISERRQELLKTSVTSVETAQTAKAAEQTALAEINVAQGDILVSQAAIKDAEAQHRQESVTLDFHTLTAPYDAVVTARQRELGTSLQAGEPVFTLIDPQSVWVLSYIDESKSGEIKVGDPARIVLRSLPGQPFQGRVARIEPEGDRVNEERKVEVAFDRLPDTLHIGEQTEVYINTVRLAHAMLVPEAAIETPRNNQGTVWTVEDGRLQRREVTLGHRLLDGRYEISAGIPANAAVVTRLRSGLRVGRRANVVERSTP